MRHSFIDEHSNIASPISSLEPRVKVITFFIFVIFIMLTKPNSFLAFGFYAILLSALIFLSKIPLGFIIKRSLTIIPFVLLAAVFLPFFKKGHILAQFSFGLFRLTITQEGMGLFYNCIIKSYLSCLSMILLVSSTRFSDLLKAFERLRCHKLIIMILSFMYRYVFVIHDEVMRLSQAKEIRSINIKNRLNLKVLSNIIGVLFLRSYERAESVYMAMCCRGFDGNVRTINNFRISGYDLAFLFIITSSLLTIKFIAG